MIVVAKKPVMADKSIMIYNNIAPHNIVAVDNISSHNVVVDYIPEYHIVANDIIPYNIVSNDIIIDECSTHAWIDYVSSHNIASNDIPVNNIIPNDSSPRSPLVAVHYAVDSGSIDRTSSHNAAPIDTTVRNFRIHGNAVRARNFATDADAVLGKCCRADSQQTKENYQRDDCFRKDFHRLFTSFQMINGFDNNPNLAKREFRSLCKLSPDGD